MEDDALANASEVTRELEQVLTDVATEDPADRWTESLEDVLKQWGERAAAYRLLHGECAQKHAKSDRYYTLPVIILSSLSGGANLSLSSLVDPAYQNEANAGIGVLSIGIGIIGAVSNYLRHSALAEAHKSSAFQWGKLSRQISVELALPPEQRVKSPMSYLRAIEQEFNGALENSPPILPKILAQYKVTFCKGIVVDSSKLAPPAETGILWPIQIHGRNERRRSLALAGAANIMGRGASRWGVLGRAARKAKAMMSPGSSRASSPIDVVVDT